MKKRALWRLCKMKFLYAVILCLLLWACGSSSSGSDDSGRTDSPEILDSLENIRDSLKDTVQDSYIQKTSFDIELVHEDGGHFDDDFEAVQVGMYRWMTANVSKNEMVTTNICYADSASNCDEYGRLYKYIYAENACPGSYHVPTKEDWQNLEGYRARYPKLDSMLQLKYGGSCTTIGGTSCSGKDSRAYYITADSLVASFKSGGEGVSFFKYSLNEYYSLRCISYVDIVGDVKDLPTCNETSAVWLDQFYVVSRKSNFYCTGSRWVDDFSDDCDKSQKNVYATFNDSVYVCKYGSWTLADIEDSRDTCNLDIDSSLMVFNGIRYACEDESWRKFSEVEDSLGYCNGMRFFKLDSIRREGAYKVYVCDTAGWRSAKNYDYLGYCGKAEYRKIDTLFMAKDTSVYFCDSTGWRPAVNTDYLRVCKTKILGKVDTLKLEKDTLLYACDSMGWRKAVIEDLYGKCDSASAYKTALFRGANYVCRDKYWDPFNSVENSLGICTPKRQGVIDTVTGGKDYICDQAKWRSTKKDDYLGNCTAKRNGEIAHYAGYGYLCKDSSWKQLSKVESELGLCKTANLGVMAATAAGTDYICTENGWTSASMTEVMGECNAKNEGKQGDYGGKPYYCNGAKWISAEIFTELGQCLLSRLGMIGKYENNMNVYICDSSGWRSARTREALLGGCTANRQDSIKVNADTAFICKKGLWTMMSANEYLGTCSSDHNGEIRSYAKKKYVCPGGGSWRVLNDFELKNGVCVPDIYGTMLQENDRYYYCYGAHWKEVGAAFGKMGSCSLTDTSTCIRPDSIYFCSKGYWEYVPPRTYLGSCRSATLKQKLYGNITYNCDTTASLDWFVMTAKDSVQGYCNTSLLGKTLTYRDSLFVCSGTYYKGWNPATEKEFLSVCDEYRSGQTFFNGFNTSKCEGGVIQSLNKKTMTDSRDGQVYEYVELKAGEVWMSEDMRYNGVDSAWCKGEMNTKCATGMHYTYAASRKACPAGWHIPSKDEFMYLHQLMRDASSVYENGAYSDIYGLSMLPNSFLEFYRMNGVEPRTRLIENHIASYWTAADTMEYYAFTKYLNVTFTETPIGAQVQQETSFKILGLSVRCKKD